MNVKKSVQLYYSKLKIARSSLLVPKAGLLAIYNSTSLFHFGNERCRLITSAQCQLLWLKHMQVLLLISSVFEVPTEGIYHTDNQNTWLTSICGAYEKKLNCKRNFQFISTAVSLSQYRYSQNQSK